MLEGILTVVLWLLLWGLPACAVIYFCYYVVSLPIRRQKRASLVLDLIETGLKDGRSAEDAVVRAARSRDRMLGLRFHLLAAHLEKGLRLDQALEKVPGLLPPRATAILKVGAQLGDLRRVMPACRRTLQDGASQVQGALNFLLVPGFVVIPIMPVITWFLLIYIMPRFQEIYKDMAPGRVLPGWWIADWLFTFQLIYVAVFLLFSALIICYVGGPNLTRGPTRWIQALADRLALWLPWRRKRLQRDFGAMLASLLDAGVPEARALRLAAQSIANGLFMARAEQAASQLGEGMTLTQAVGALDAAGEFRWRLDNARHGSGGFLNALAGWLEALEAKAFQQEQTAAQIVTTGAVLINGVLVGLFVIGMFLALINLVEEGVLW